MEKSTTKLVAHVNVDQAKIGEAEEKVMRLSELLKETHSLAGELASIEITVSVNI